MFCILGTSVLVGRILISLPITFCLKFDEEIYVFRKRGVVRGSRVNWTKEQKQYLHKK